MQLEIELKYPVDDLQRVRKLLEDLGATFELPIRQVDLYFRHPVRDFAQTDEALRLRQVGEENCITYKGPKIDAQTKTRREIELSLESGQKSVDSWREMLDILGFSRVRDVAKERIPGIVMWEGGEVHLALDRVTGLGEFLELEILADESELDSARKRLASLAKKLGLDRSERRGYLDLLLSNPET
jgi:adenylate cyclase, class 2